MNKRADPTTLSCKKLLLSITQVRILSGFNLLCDTSHSDASDASDIRCCERVLF
jgi:hypothetical protein